MLVTVAIPGWPTAGAAEPHAGYLKEIRAGLRFIWHDRLLRALAFCLALMNFVETPLFAVVLPVYADRVYGSAVDLGLIFSAIGSGLLIGGLGYGFFVTRATRITRRAIWLVSMFAAPVLYWVLLARPPVLVVAAVAFATSLLAGPNNAILVTIRHERAPIALRARVFSTFTAISMAMIPLGLLAVGQLISVAGLGPTLLALALMTQVLALGALVAPALKGMDIPVAAESSVLSR
jgi:hypothetical protein